MSQVQVFEFTTPLGRLVSGDAMKKHLATDDNQQPVLIKTGPNAGQQREDYYVGVAIPKTPNVDWKQEPWGQQIVTAANAGFPHLIDNQGTNLNPNMPVALKVIDGDSTFPNKAGNKPCDKEGYPGHWVINAATSGMSARLYKWSQQQQKPLPLPEGDEIKRGYYVQLNAKVDPNGSAQQPGVYITPSMICMIAYGEEIYSGPNADDAGFGMNGALPSGASLTPVGGVAPTGGQPAQQPPVQPAQQPAVQPAHDLANGPGAAITPPPLDEVTPPPVDDPVLTYNGQQRKKSEWLAMPGWTEAMVNQHCKPL